MARGALDIWTVYRHPTDYPDKYVARKFTVGGGGTGGIVRASTDMFVEDTLEDVRALIPSGLVCLERDNRDEPHIVETWI